MRRTLYTDEHDEFRRAFRTFLQKEAVPRTELWEVQGAVDREFWAKAGAQGFLGFDAPVEFGGQGVQDFRYNAVILEEVVTTGTAGDGFSLQNDIAAPYLTDYCTDEQRARWLPLFTSGHLIPSLALSEPDAGSDLARIRTTARYDGDEVVVDGSKTFITNGATTDLAIVLTRTGERDGKGMTLVAVEFGTPGFTRGAPLHKIGRRAQDTAELFFESCRVRRANIIGEPGQAFATVMRNLPRERLSIAVSAVASARHALGLALEYTRDRSTFGKPLATHQTVTHALAEMAIDVDVLQSHVDRCVEALNAGELTPEDAAGAKYAATETEWQVVDRALQLFGGYGYMEEYPIARQWRNARVQRIYGGTNEIMKEVVGRALIG